MYSKEGLKAELDILVEQILSARDLEKLKETTRENFPDLAKSLEPRLRELHWKRFDLKHQFDECFKEHEEKQPDDEGWIEHDGEYLPVEGKTFVDIKFQGADTVYNSKAGGFYWAHWVLEDNPEYKITHYRISEIDKLRKIALENGLKPNQVYKVEKKKDKTTTQTGTIELGFPEPKVEFCLAEYALSKKNNLDILTPYEVIELISDYLEGKR